MPGPSSTDFRSCLGRGCSTWPGCRLPLVLHLEPVLHATGLASCVAMKHLGKLRLLVWVAIETDLVGEGVATSVWRGGGQAGLVGVSVRQARLEP